MVTEIDVMLTDYALFVLCSVFAWILARQKGKDHHLRAALVGFFIALGVSSLIGGTVHGFFADKTLLANLILWRATMITLGVVAFFSWMVAVDLFVPRYRYLVMGCAATLCVFYTGYVLFITSNFALALYNTAASALALFIGFSAEYYRTRKGILLYGVVGLLLTFVASYVQQARIAIHPVYFNHNALYHVLEAASLILLFIAFRQLLATRKI